MFDYNEEMLPDDLINNILEIKQGRLRIINLTDLIKKRWLADACFDLNDDDDMFGEVGFQKAMKRIENPKTFLQNLKGLKNSMKSMIGIHISVLLSDFIYVKSSP